MEVIIDFPDADQLLAFKEIDILICDIIEYACLDYGREYVTELKDTLLEGYEESLDRVTLDSWFNRVCDIVFTAIPDGIPEVMCVDVEEVISDWCDTGFTYTIIGPTLIKVSYAFNHGNYHKLWEVN